MSRPYGPIQLTAGAMASVDVDAGAAFCVIENSCVNIDLAVSFQVNSPSQASYVAGFPWDGYIQAGGSKRLTLPPNDGRWTGRIWLYPISVATQSATTGAGSSYSRAIVTTFGSHEEPQDFQGVIRGLDITSQPRVIGLPMTAPLTFENLYVTMPTVFATFSALYLPAYNLSATNIANLRANIYIYDIRCEAMTVGRCQVQLFLRALDSGLNPLGTDYPVCAFSISRAGASGPSTPFVWSSAVPLRRVVSTLPANAASLRTAFQIMDGDGGMQASFSMHMTGDALNTGVVAAYGEQTPSYLPSGGLF